MNLKESRKNREARYAVLDGFPHGEKRPLRRQEVLSLVGGEKRKGGGGTSVMGKKGKGGKGPLGIIKVLILKGEGGTRRTAGSEKKSLLRYRRERQQRARSAKLKLLSEKRKQCDASEKMEGGNRGGRRGS